MKTKTFRRFDEAFIGWMRTWGIAFLRAALGIVFLWFGALKVFGASPVADLIRAAYPFMPYPGFILILGAWEALIGIGLIFKLALRLTLGLLWLQMLGTFAALLLSPPLFFSGYNVLLLTVQGEFVVKNLVLIAAGIVIGGHEVTPVKLNE